MVILRLLGLLLLFNFLQGEEAKIDILLDETTVSDGSPILGSLNITHDPSDLIDLESTLYNRKPVSLQAVRKVRFDSSLVVDTFRFKLDPLPVGLHMLGSFEIKVGKQTVKSNPVSLEVKKRVSIPLVKKTTKSAPASDIVNAVSDRKPYLILEQIGPGLGPFYPGQKIKMGYRYVFQGDIELRQEVLPMLDQTILEKVGEKQIADDQKGAVSIREITQVVKLSDTGDYSFPKSIISGYAYSDRGWGPKTYYEPQLRAEIDPFTIVVSPFPENKKPPFFSGAVGPFQISRQVDVPPLLKIGDKLTFNLIFQGAGELSTLKPLNLFCLPGWSGFFSVGDLPPQGALKKGEMTFSYEIRPLNNLVSEIPSVYFAYFDPMDISYKVIKTAPYKFDLKEPVFQENKESASAIVLKPVDMQATLKEPAFTTNQDRKLENIPKAPFSTSYVLLMIPASLLGYFFYSLFEERREAEKNRPLSISEQFLQLKYLVHDKRFVDRAQSIIQGVYGQKPYPLEIDNYLKSLSEARFGPSPVESFESYYKELEALCMQNGN